MLQVGVGEEAVTAYIVTAAKLWSQKWVVGIVLVWKLSGSHFSCIVGSISQCEIASAFVETGGEDDVWEDHFRYSQLNFLSR